MDKILTQFAVMLISFFAVWFLLSRIDYLQEGDVQKFAKESEKKLSELILKSIKATNDEVEDKRIKAALDSIKSRLCEGMDLDCDKIKLHIIRSSDINAFALPDNNMVIYTGLLDYAGNAEEVAGVMAHEIGHMQKNHVMKKLVKEIGMEMLFTIAGGDAGNDIARETAKVLSSSAFDRKQEREADKFAVECLAKTNIDPQPLSNLFFRLSRKDEVPEEMAWISTHPDSKERAAEIIKLRKEYTFTPRDILHTPWKDVQRYLSKKQEDSDDKSDKDAEVIDEEEIEVSADTTAAE
ncbi:MAG TPA: M48 family metallopeptidase [Ohtaekwangia sp.]|uniref:M48 family metallopeptidase n=1 Tax=Ohtaekwangia sp. TaxID=2066019 RepID=UPI002F937EDF